jgi:hypothetical protein
MNEEDSKNEADKNLDDQWKCRIWDWMRDISKSESDKDRDDKWNRWRYDQVLRWVSLVFVLILVALFVLCNRHTDLPSQLKCGQTEALWTTLALLIAWKDFLVGAVVVAFIWLVRSLWE